MEPTKPIRSTLPVKGPSASLEARVERLEAIQEIIDLEAQYCRRWDADDGDGWAALFTPDGVFHCVDLVGRPGFTRTGRADLSAFCQEFQLGMARLHLVTTYEIAVDGPAATARTSFECHRAALGDHPHIGMLSGYYETEYLRLDEGWRIALRTEHLVFNREETYYVHA